MKNQGKTLAIHFPEKVHRMDENGVILKEPKVTERYGVHGIDAGLYEAYQNAQKVVEVVSLSELVNHFRGVGESYDVVGELAIDYAYDISKAPSPESLEGCTIVWNNDMRFSSDNLLSVVANYKTIEQAINKGIKVYIKID